MKKLTIAILLALTLGMHGAFIAEAKPMLRIELASYEELASNIGELSNILGNPMINLGLAAFGNLVGSPGLLGVDQTKPIRWALYPEGDGLHKNEWVLLLPVSGDGQELLESLGVSYDLLRDDGLMRRFKANRTVQSFEEMSARFADGYAVLSPAEILVPRVVEALESDAGAFSPKGISGAVKIGVDVPKVVPLLKSALEGIAAVTVHNDQGEEGLRLAASEFNKLYYSSVLTLLEQVSEIGVGIQCDAQGLTFYSRFDAMPDTALYSVAQETVTPSEKLRALIPDDAIGFYAGGSFGAMLKHFLEPYGDMVEKMFEIQRDMLGQLPDAPKIDVELGPLIERIKTSAEHFGESMVVSVGPGAGDDGGVVVFEAFEMKDPEAMLKSMEEGFAKLSELYAGMGAPMRLVRKEDREAGEIVVRRFAFELTEAAAAEDGRVADDKAKEAWDRIMAEMGDQMEWLKGRTLELAMVRGVLLQSFGPENSLDPFIAKALGEDSQDNITGRVQSLFPEIRNMESASELWLFKPLAFMKLLGPLAMGLEEMGDIFENLPDEGEGLGGLTMTAPPTTMYAFRLSASSLSSLARTAAEMQRRNPRGVNIGRPREAPPGEPVEVILPEE